MELIICMIVIALCAVVSEFRLLKRDKKIAILQARIADREWSMDELHKLGIEAVEEGELYFAVLEEQLGFDEAMKLIDEKKEQMREELEANANG